MEKKDFLAQYQSKEWYELSKRIKARDHNTCQICGCNNKPLNVHHLTYGHNGSILVDEEYLITVCEDCHKQLHIEQQNFNSLLEDLKVCFTPIELNDILHNIFKKYSNLYTLSPNRIPPIQSGMDGREYAKENIRNWRRRVHEKSFKDRLIGDYYDNQLSGRSTQEDKENFFKEFGVTLDEYILQNKEECLLIERRCKEIKEKIDKGLAPF